MTRWEFRQIYAESSPAGWMVRWPTQSERVETVLDRMGDDGWEAVSIAAVADGGATVGMHYLLKRPRQG